VVCNKHAAAAWALVCALAVPVHAESTAARELAGAGSVEETSCRSGNITVFAEDREDARVACEGAADALRFLASHGLDVGEGIVIEVVEVLPDTAEPSALGCYLDRERRVAVLAYAEASRRGTWFDMPLDRSLYRSLVAHEVAHAMAACNFKPAQPSIQAHEYVAYVTMFATMAPDPREAVLARYPGDGYDDDAQMSSTIYLFDPLRFGVEAYRHFLRAENGHAYLQRVLEGEALVEQ
jgi:hypothetical protein